MPTFYEFFAGGGMARAGLGQGWDCLFANDFDHKKGEVYTQNWGKGALRVGDVAQIQVADIPGRADLIWASFPCQDLSLAGGGAGLRGERSGTFWPFWKLVKGLKAAGRGPKIVVLENVNGTLTSHKGKDFAAIASALALEGFQFGAMIVDAALFVPHSRPRLFIVAVERGVWIPESLRLATPSATWHPRALRTAFESLPKEVRSKWIWWNVPTPKARKSRFADLIQDEPDGVSWHSPAETKKLLGMMSRVNLAKVADARRQNRRVVGAIYKRTRLDEDGIKVQRAEVRFDDIAGCLRTPAGGSSRQLILVVEGKSVRSRLISTRETARLMGLPDKYKLPSNYNEAYHLTGDGVVVPVVRHLASALFEKILLSEEFELRAA